MEMKAVKCYSCLEMEQLQRKPANLREQAYHSLTMEAPTGHDRHHGLAMLSIDQLLLNCFSCCFFMEPHEL